MRRSTATLLFLAVAPAVAVRAARTEPPSPPSGLVTEAVEAGSYAALAGMAAGDVLLMTSFPPETPGGVAPEPLPLRYPYELEELFVEQNPRREVHLEGLRGEERKVWTFPRGVSLVNAGLRARPVLEEGLLRIYARAKEGLTQNPPTGAEEELRPAARQAQERGDPHLAAWLLLQLAQGHAKGGRWAEADAAYRETVESLGPAGSSADLSQRLQDWGTKRIENNDFSGALAVFERALATDRARGASPLSAAWSLKGLGDATSPNDSPGAVAYFRQALDLRRDLAPGSSDLGITLVDLGIEAGRSGDLDAAQPLFAEALAIEERLRPDSRQVAMLLNNLGVLSGMRGDLAGEEGFYRRSLRLKEALGATPEQLATTLSNLGVTAKERGRLAEAEGYYRRALELLRSANPESLLVAKDLHNLANLALRRFDLDAAEDALNRAIAITRKLAPQSLDLPGYVGTLGAIAHRRGDLPRARELTQQALAAYPNPGPADLGWTNAIVELASIEREAGNGTQAEELLRRATGERIEEAPQTLAFVGVWSERSLLAAQRGDLALADAMLQRALAIQDRLAPQSLDHAELLRQLGRVQLRAGAPQAGVESLCRAIAVIEGARSVRGGSDTQRLLTEAQVTGFYHDCAAALAGQGEAERAFLLLEQGRARLFLQRLAERDLVFARDLPPELDLRRRRLNRRYEEKEGELARLDLGKDASAAEKLAAELRALGREQEELQQTIRERSSVLAALRPEAPPGLAALGAALEPGTVLLSYSVGEDSTLLFALATGGPGGKATLTTRTLPLPAAELRAKVAAFRARLQDEHSPLSRLRAGGSELYELLLRPVASALARAERLLVVGDGPLLSLPFSALVRKGRYLAETVPIHSVLSATVYAHLRKARPRPFGPDTVAFTGVGDPIYPKNRTDPSGVRASSESPGAGLEEAVRRGLTLSPLPASRREVESIAALFPSPRLLLAADATEENVKALGGGVRTLHFAVHGLLNERMPLDSALALTLPEQPAEGRENGLLHAWEILESVRLDADLVTLSACDSGLGQETGGEGLVGLTRAFQLAGARSVLASLWSVSDASTAELMRRFYRHLAAGEGKDEALRRAQSEMLRAAGGRWAHPFHWAAFQLVGDRR